MRSSLCCARGRTDTDLIDISVGGKGGGGVGEAQFGRITALGSLSVFVFELSGLTGGVCPLQCPTRDVFYNRL